MLPISGKALNKFAVFGLILVDKLTFLFSLIVYHESIKSSISQIKIYNYYHVFGFAILNGIVINSYISTK